MMDRDLSYHIRVRARTLVYAIRSDEKERQHKQEAPSFVSRRYTDVHEAYHGDVFPSSYSKLVVWYGVFAAESHISG